MSNEMKSLLVLVLATAFHVSVKCENCSNFGYELLTTGIDQLNHEYLTLQMSHELLQKTLQRHLKQSEPLISTLQAQLERRNADLVQLQRQVLVLSEESVKNAESRKNLQEQVEALEKNQKALQQQLEKSNENISTLQNLIKSNVSVADVKWVSWSVDRPIPKNAVLAGYDHDDAVYVARVHHNGDDLVAKALPTRQAIYHGYNRGELRVERCEVLTGSHFSWIRDSNGNVPDNAVTVGKTHTGVQNYIGRAQYGSSTTPGTVNGPQGCLYLPYDWSEHKYTSYEVLVHD